MKNRILLLTTLLVCSVSHASVVINATRVIYHESSKKVNVQVVNRSKTTHLIQTWIDDGDKDSLPENIKTPFIVTPPVVKVDANSGQTLTISKFGDDSSLPKNKEKTFWLNVIDIPPLPEDKTGGTNYLQVAIRSRIKLFWRPDNLAIPYDDIPKHISLKKDSGRYCLTNETPYFITVVQVNRWDGKSNGVMSIKKENNIIKKAKFIEPFSCSKMNDLTNELTGGIYQVVYLDDYGSKRPALVKAP